MRPGIDLGFVALVDAAPLIVAKVRGLFAEEGIDASLHREASWATIRDKVAAGVHQGAHMLAPLAIAANLGVGSEPAAMIVPMSLNAHGATLGVSAGLAAEMGGDLTPQALARAVAAHRKAGRPAVSFAVVFPYSMHNYMLRFWAASGGVDPDSDIRITVAPPTAVAARLKSGEIDGFCVGAPWGQMCQADSDARIVLDAASFWPGGPDKVLALSGAWTDREPEQTVALTRAVIRGALWADDPANAGELASLLSKREWLGAPRELILGSLNQIRFARFGALHPWRGHAAWIASQMLRWGQLDLATDVETAVNCYRPDLFRDAAGDAGLNVALADSRIEGAHAEAWQLPGVKGPVAMGADAIFGGAPFNADQLRAYAASFAISRAKA